MRPTEVTAIFKMPGDKRLEHFLETVSKNKMAYGISDDEGWALLGDNDDTDIIPFFQSPELADVFRKAAGFNDYEVEEIDWDLLMEWLPELEEDGAMVAVCPNTHFEGPIEEPGRLLGALKG
ncbi:MAG TPA: DUF2750 domain-containing protein [Saprospiraceae bacterium]|nr:DUF2750 domain-containing protein [Saprospiraceae bacterium]